jgi:hypothetical protein
VQGSSADPLFDGSKLAQQNVVVVTYNYRRIFFSDQANPVGILGFLDGGNDFPTTNMGIQDTILALTWVKNNIPFFGGDPTRVTGNIPNFGSNSSLWRVQRWIIDPCASHISQSKEPVQTCHYPIRSAKLSARVARCFERYCRRVCFVSPQLHQCRLCEKCKCFVHCVGYRDDVIEWTMA